jgi:hypothetical protein
MSLCFLEVSYGHRSGRLPESQYITYLVAHFRRDVFHDEDQQRRKTCKKAKDFRRIESSAQSVRHAAVEGTYERLESTAELESIFQACVAGDLEAVKNEYEEFERRPEQIPFLSQLATLAAQRGQAEVLQFCFEKGYASDEYLKSAVRRPSRIGILEVLYASNWRKMQESPQVMGQMAQDLIQPWNTSEALEWFLDHVEAIIRFIRGAAITKAASFSYHPPATLMRKLLQVNLKAARNPDALAYAASRGYADVVQQMLDAGLAADATPPAMEFMDIVRDGNYKTALFYAVSGDHENLKPDDGHLETVKILLDNGASVQRVCGYNQLTPFAVALVDLRKNKRAMTKLLLSYPDNV